MAQYIRECEKTKLDLEAYVKRYEEIKKQIEPEPWYKSESSILAGLGLALMTGIVVGQSLR